MNAHHKDAAYWIKKLGLAPHPEGGHFRQTYRSELAIAQSALPPEFSGPRPVSTAIYFLLDGRSFSAFHRLRSDEMWHFYLEGELLVHVIDNAGKHSNIRLGGDPEQGLVMQGVVKAGCWFAAGLANVDSFALVGCTVAPGFDFADFELAKRSELIRLYPRHRELIERFTRA